MRPGGPSLGRAGRHFLGPFYPPPFVWVPMPPRVFLCSITQRQETAAFQPRWNLDTPAIARGIPVFVDGGR